MESYRSISNCSSGGGFRLENYPPKACGFPNLLWLHEKRMRFICRRKYNDGKEIEAEKIKRIRVFGALPVSSQSAPYQDSGNTAAWIVRREFLKRGATIGVGTLIAPAFLRRGWAASKDRVVI
jgi:hypothetical protein